MKTFTKNIKRNILIFSLLFLCTPCMLQAQYPYLFAHGGGTTSSRSIVRMYDGALAVAYYENSTNGVLALVNIHTGHKIEVELDQGITCYDMSITNDTVFLCGQHVVPPSNIYGCIVILPISEFYSSTANITYFEPSYWMQSILTNIVSYTDGYNGIRLACIGFYYYNCDGSLPFPSGLSNSYVINGPFTTCVENFALALTAPPLGGSNSAKVMRFINPTEHPDEVLQDVVATDNYVVFVGVDSETPHSIIIHVCPKTNNISITPITKTVLADPFGSYTKFILNDNYGSPQYKVVALNEDSIAIAATHEDYTGSQYDIHIRTIELNTMTMTHSQTIPNNNYSKFKDMTYMPDNGKLELLYNHNHSEYGHIDMFCRIDPYRTFFPYNTPAKSLVNDEEYQSIHKMKYGYFIATGGDYGVVGNSNSHTPYCYKEINIQPIITSILTKTQSFFDYDQLNPHPYTIQSQVPTTEGPIDIICTE